MVAGSKGHDRSASASRDADLPVVRVRLSPADARPFARALASVSSDDAVRDLLYVTADPRETQRCRLSAVLLLDGVLEAHTLTHVTHDGPALTALESSPAVGTGGSQADVGRDTDPDRTQACTLVPIETLPGLRAALDRVQTAAIATAQQALREAYAAAIAQQPGRLAGDLRSAVSGVEFAADRTGEVSVFFYFDAEVPPVESGAEHHLWHYSPELDEVGERLRPESWWERVVEDLQTIAGRIRTHGLAVPKK